MQALMQLWPQVVVWLVAQQTVLSWPTQSAAVVQSPFPHPEGVGVGVGLGMNWVTAP
jgi:hypothetical protein